MQWNWMPRNGAVTEGTAALAEQLRRSSVQIGTGRGGGSGVVWDSDNKFTRIITNAHVVRGPIAAVRLHDGRTVEGRVIQRDDKRDLVALIVELGNAPVARIGDSSILRSGELVFAMGNPLGIVGALAMGVVHSSGSHWISADLQLAPGNSGGILANADGQVVGINSMIAYGLALAIPSNEVKRFLARQSFAEAA